MRISLLSFPVSLCRIPHWIRCHWFMLRKMRPHQLQLLWQMMTIRSWKLVCRLLSWDRTNRNVRVIIVVIRGNVTIETAGEFELKSSTPLETLHHPPTHTNEHLRKTLLHDPRSPIHSILICSRSLSRFVNPEVENNRNGSVPQIVQK